MDVAIKVNLVGGSMLTRDLFTYALSEAGIHVSAQPTLPADSNEVALVVAADEEPGKLLTETLSNRSILVADINPDDESTADFVLDGADAIISLGASAGDLADAVRTVAAGGTVIAPRPARRLSELARASRAATTPERSMLTNREHDILLSIGRGESVKQTASTLGISAKTVENLQSRLFRKLDVRNRAQAFAQAHSMGLLNVAARNEDFNNEYLNN